MAFINNFSVIFEKMSNQSQLSSNYPSANTRQEKSFLQSQQAPSITSFAPISTHNFTVATRIKPKNSQQENSKIIIHKNKEQIHIESTKAHKNTYIGSKSKNFKMNSIFDETTTNSQIFNSLVKQKLNLLKRNCNISVMAYGATNSGKTFTIFGEQRVALIKNTNFETNSLNSNSGLVYQCGSYLINELFRQKFKFYLSYLQIYNENVQDLLAERSLKKNYLNIFQDHLGKINIPELTKIQVQDYEHLCNLIGKGNEMRVQASNHVNSLSSRSHAILQLDIFSVEDQDSLDTYVPIDVNFMIIDLAGSQKSTPYFQESNQILLKEGSNINKSLLALGNCIKNLANGDTHIPYRDSKLTRLLKENLSGHCQNIMIACISQQMSQFQETINTLQYATKACKIQSFDTKNVKERTSYLKIPCEYCHMTLDFDYINSFMKHHGFEVVDKMYKNNFNNDLTQKRRNLLQNDKQNRKAVDITRIDCTSKQARKGRSISCKSRKSIERQKLAKPTKQSLTFKNLLIEKSQKVNETGERCKLKMKKTDKPTKANLQSNIQEAPKNHFLSRNMQDKENYGLKQAKYSGFFMENTSDSLFTAKNREYIKQQLQNEQQQNWMVKQKKVEPRSKQNLPNVLNLEIRQFEQQKNNINGEDQEIKYFASVGVKRMKPDSFEQKINVDFQSLKAAESKPRIKIIPKLRN